MFNFVQNKEIDIQKIDLVYGENVDGEDLALIKKNLSLILTDKENFEPT